MPSFVLAIARLEAPSSSTTVVGPFENRVSAQEWFNTYGLMIYDPCKYVHGILELKSPTEASIQMGEPFIKITSHPPVSGEHTTDLVYCVLLWKPTESPAVIGPFKYETNAQDFFKEVHKIHLAHMTQKELSAVLYIEAIVDPLTMAAQAVGEPER